MSRSRTTAVVNGSGNTVRSALVRSARSEVIRKSPSERVKAALLGVKGSLLPETQGHKAHAVDENPMSRLKLLLVSIIVLWGSACSRLFPRSHPS